jgi:hypothetical protein
MTWVSFPEVGPWFGGCGPHPSRWSRDEWGTRLGELVVGYGLDFIEKF